MRQLEEGFTVIFGLRLSGPAKAFARELPVFACRRHCGAPARKCPLSTLSLSTGNRGRRYESDAGAVFPAIQEGAVPMERGQYPQGEATRRRCRPPQTAHTRRPSCERGRSNEKRPPTVRRPHSGPSTVAAASSSARAWTAFSVSLLSCPSVQSRGTRKPNCFFRDAFPDHRYEGTLPENVTM